MTICRSGAALVDRAPRSVGVTGNRGTRRPEIAAWAAGRFASDDFLGAHVGLLRRAARQAPAGVQGAARKRS